MEQCHAADNCLYLLAVLDGAEAVHLVRLPLAAGSSAVTDVLGDVLFKLIDNPINALLTGNFLGCLTWAVLLGVSFRKAPDSFRGHLQVIAEGVSDIVRYVIRLAPIGIFGLVCVTVATVGLEALAGYASLAMLSSRAVSVHCA